MTTRQTEQNDVLGDFTTRLDKIGIEYMLVGSMALVHYAVPRTTVDIDIVLNIKPQQTELFLAEFSSDFYIPMNRARQAIRENGMFNVLDNRTILKVDCVVLKNTEFEMNAFSRRRKVNYAGDFEVWIIGKEDLILSKLKWAKAGGSERQLIDVASILRNGYDEEYVEAWARELGLTELLNESLALIKKNYDDGHDS